MRCINSSLAKVRSLCRVCPANSAPRASVRSPALPPVAALLTSRQAHICARSALSGGCSSRLMQGPAPSPARRMHAAAGQGNSSSPIQELHPLELKEILERISQGDADDVQLIDVREEFEHQTASLPGFKLMPMSRLQEWIQDIHEEMDADKETILLCHAGVRSRNVAGFLASQGFTQLRNVTGGIDAYSREVDSSVPLY
ncbi:g7295 [Coccomyxa viridis]|uniref:G7295 protein n=1 Tax=Coccomyxa viridis TaxID=1274662 RepID=A0ABP1FXI0_9CHLO